MSAATGGYTLQACILVLGQVTQVRVNFSIDRKNIMNCLSQAGYCNMTVRTKQLCVIISI